MLSAFFSAALQRILARAGNPKTIIAALSGGRDSVVLLHLLVNSRERFPSGTRLVAAHLNHALRGEDAELDQEFCRGLAASHKVEFALRRADAAKTARDERLNIEEAGRILRQRFFLDLAEVGGGAVVLTGHHADDQAETVLLHLRRGAHRRGLAGMREFVEIPVAPGRKIGIGRPLLAVGREELCEYAARHRLVWREDATNSDASFYRNRIRQRILPMLEALIPGFRERILNRAAAIRVKEDRLNAQGVRLAESLSRREDGGCFFRLDGEALADPERLAYAFRQVVEGETGCRVSNRSILSRLSRLAEFGRLGEALSLPGGLLARREREGLFFCFPDRDEREGGGETILPTPPFNVSVAGLTVQAEWLSAPDQFVAADRGDPGAEWLNPAGICWPLRLRPALSGERFRLLGAPGSKKIQDILVDLKIPRRKRGLARVLADGAGALWLWPVRLAHRARLEGSNTKALRVCIREIHQELR